MRLPGGGRMFLAQEGQQLLAFGRREADAIFDWHPLQLAVILKGTSSISFTPHFTTDGVLVSVEPFSPEIRLNLSKANHLPAFQRDNDFAFAIDCDAPRHRRRGQGLLPKHPAIGEV